MPSNLPQILLILSVTVLFSLQISGDENVRLGGWKQIADPSESGVQEIGKFAVDEHNNQTKSELKFEKVISGESQVVAGVNYRLIVSAKDGEVSRDYEAVVYERSWEHFRNLTSFKPVAN